ncbi:recombinase family protein [Roseomonas mucosa]|nr:recombinase family protein [Roseomonas mucosa]
MANGKFCLTRAVRLRLGWPRTRSCLRAALPSQLPGEATHHGGEHGTAAAHLARPADGHANVDRPAALGPGLTAPSAVGGAVLARPGLDRLRDAVKGHEVDRVLVTAPDRLARNYVHQMVLLEEWARAGCAAEFLDRPMSDDPHDHLLLQIRGAAAEYERTLIAERMRRG